LCCAYVSGQFVCGSDSSNQRQQQQQQQRWPEAAAAAAAQCMYVRMLQLMTTHKA
jgi:hypothetical protein